jgi:uncharacterized protein
LKKPARLLAAMLCAGALATLGALAACNGDGPAQQDYQPLVTFDSARARVLTAADTFVLRVEVADREHQRAYGLMERPHLDDDAGMVFLYPADQPGDAGFWMFRTRIPLDIAYFGEDGVIRGIRAMEPCPHAHPGGCPSYPPGVAYRGALEVNRGWFAARGVGVGDRIVVER